MEDSQHFRHAARPKSWGSRDGQVRTMRTAFITYRRLRPIWKIVTQPQPVESTAFPCSYFFWVWVPLRSNQRQRKHHFVAAFCFADGGPLFWTLVGCHGGKQISHHQPTQKKRVRPFINLQQPVVPFFLQKGTSWALGVCTQALLS